jgi:hypothetical protein
MIVNAAKKAYYKAFILARDFWDEFPERPPHPALSPQGRGILFISSPLWGEE